MLLARKSFLLVFLMVAMLFSDSFAADGSRDIELGISTAWGRYNLGVGEDPGLAINIENKSKKDRLVKINWTLKDIDGIAVTEGEKKLNVSPGKSTHNVELQLPEMGYYSFTTIYNDGQEDRKLIATLAWINECTNKKADFSSPFGVNGHNTFGHFEMYRRMGVAKSRVDFDWKLFEPRDGEFELCGEKDKRDFGLAKEAEKSGVLLHAIIGYNPPWIKTAKGQGTIHERYLAFVRNVVTRYKKRIFIWDIWNEPQYTWKGSKEEFGILMGKAYKLIKSIQPESVVIMNGHPFEGELAGYTLENLKPLNGFMPFDVIGIHPYSRPKSPDAINFLDHARNIKAWIDKNAPGKEMWISELGWPTSTDALGVTELQQASYMVRSLVMGLAAGAKEYIYYMPFSGKDATYSEAQYGFWRHDFTPKPLAAVYANMAACLHPSKYLDEIEIAAALRCFAFEQDKKAVIVLWAVDDPVNMVFKNNTPKGFSLFRADGSSLAEFGKTLPVGELPLVIKTSMSELDNFKNWIKSGAITLKNPITIKSFTPAADGFHLLVMNKTGVPMPVIMEPAPLDGVTYINDEYNETDRPKLGFTMPEYEKEVVLRLKYKHIPINVNYNIRLRSPRSEMEAVLPVRIYDAHRMKEDIKIDGNLEKWQKYKPIVIDTQLSIAPADMQKEWRGKADLSTRAWMGWNSTGLIFAAEVSDETHVGKGKKRNSLWVMDGLQFAFDVRKGIVLDYPSPTYAEFATALTQENVRTDIYTGVGTTKINSCVIRDEKAKKTVYELLIPWGIVEADITPGEGDFISANFIFNDLDTMGIRKWLELSKGIGITKNPSYYPRFRLRGLENN